MPVVYPTYRPHPKRRQPIGGGLRVNWSNPVTTGLVFCSPFGDGRFLDLVAGRVPPVNVPGDNRNPTAFGSMLYTDDATSNGLRYDMSEDMNAAGFTFCFSLIPDTAGARNFGHVFLAESTSGTDITRFSQSGTTAGAFRLHLVSTQVATITVPTGVPSHVVITLDEPSNDWVVYVDGVVSNSGNAPGVRADLNRLWIGRHPSTGFTVSAPIGGFAVWRRALTAGEVKGLYEDRNSIFAARNRFVMQPAASGGVTVGSGLTSGSRLNRVRLAA